MANNAGAGSEDSGRLSSPYSPYSSYSSSPPSPPILCAELNNLSRWASRVEIESFLNQVKFHCDGNAKCVVNFAAEIKKIDNLFYSDERYRLRIVGHTKITFVVVPSDHPKVISELREYFVSRLESD
jgi:hypothetical protein